MLLDTALKQFPVRAGILSLRLKTKKNNNKIQGIMLGSSWQNTTINLEETEIKSQKAQWNIRARDEIGTHDPPKSKSGAVSLWAAGCNSIQYADLAEAKGEVPVNEKTLQ